MKVLPASFYQREDVVTIAKDLIGKWLFTKFGSEITGGPIIETEAYAGINDKACHAYNNRRTKRTEIMFAKGGVAYIYLCYGMHYLLNVVTNKKNVPHAVLIRAILPVVGSSFMLKRRQKQVADRNLTNGPGALCQALGLQKQHNGLSFTKPPLWIEDYPTLLKEEAILTNKRIGVNYAEEDALLPYRFCLKNPNEIFNTL